MSGDRVFRVNRIPDAVCPGCGNTLDGSVCTNADALPGPGQLSMCGRCGYVGIFTETLALRELTDEEFASIPPDTLVLIGRIEQERRAAAHLSPTLASLRIHARLQGRTVKEELKAMLAGRDRRQREHPGK